MKERLEVVTVLNMVDATAQPAQVTEDELCGLPLNTFLHVLQMLSVRWVEIYVQATARTLEVTPEGSAEAVKGTEFEREAGAPAMVALARDSMRETAAAGRAFLAAMERMNALGLKLAASPLGKVMERVVRAAQRKGRP